jgi:hypothetical protein
VLLDWFEPAVAGVGRDFVVEVSRYDIVEVFGCVQSRIEGSIALALYFADYLRNES